MPRSWQNFLSYLVLTLVAIAALPDLGALSNVPGKSVNTVSSDSPLEEEDENSDLNLKYLCAGMDLAVAVTHRRLPHESCTIPQSHISEIPTPPPLHP